VNADPKPTMRQYAQRRLKELHEELELGQKQLAGLEARAAELRSTMFRISGAIQVLEDVLRHGDGAAEDAGDAPPNGGPARRSAEG